MNSMKSFRYQKIWLIITFISLVSCKKQADISPDQTILKKENAFFYKEKVSPSANEKDLVDTIINFCKKGDSTAHFSNKIIAKYGYPQWDLALPISNANGLKSLFIPVVDTGSRVQLIIFAYQDSRKHVIFKFIDRNTEQTQLPKASADSRIFCKESLTGIFGALDKSVAAARVPKNSSMEQINSNGSYIESFCWWITWHYEDGSVGVSNSQCSYQIIITPGISRNSGLPDALIGVYEDIQVGDGGGGLEADNADITFLTNIVNNGFVCSDLIKTNEVVQTNDSRIKEYEWRAFRNGFWALFSFDQGSHKKVSTSDMPTPHWEWEHLEHKSMGAVGVIPAVSVDYKELTSLATTGRFYSSMSVKFEISYKFISRSGPLLMQFVYDASHLFNVND